jgi:hypothetical protein
MGLGKAKICEFNLEVLSN